MPRSSDEFALPTRATTMDDAWLSVRDAARHALGGRFKSRNLSTVQMPHFPAAAETGEFYFGGSSGRKSVWTFVRQLRGPHLSTCA
jgi:hypothetical protein